MNLFKSSLPKIVQNQNNSVNNWQNDALKALAPNSMQLYDFSLLKGANIDGLMPLSGRVQANRDNLFHSLDKRSRKANVRGDSM